MRVRNLVEHDHQAIAGRFVEHSVLEGKRGQGLALEKHALVHGIAG
jgi:hypothetical protein